MTVANLHAGAAGTLESGIQFSTNPPATGPTITVDGLKAGSTSTLQFTVSGCSPANFTVATSADRTAIEVTVNSLSGTGSASYTVDTSVDAKAAANGTGVLTIKAYTSGRPNIVNTFIKGKAGGGDGEDEEDLM